MINKEFGFMEKRLVFKRPENPMLSPQSNESVDSIGRDYETILALYKKVGMEEMERAIDEMIRSTVYYNTPGLQERTVKEKQLLENELIGRKEFFLEKLDRAISGEELSLAEKRYILGSASNIAENAIGRLKDQDLSRKITDIWRYGSQYTDLERLAGQRNSLRYEMAQMEIVADRSKLPQFYSRPLSEIIEDIITATDNFRNIEYHGNPSESQKSEVLALLNKPVSEYSVDDAIKLTTEIRGGALETQQLYPVVGDRADRILSELKSE